MSESGQGFSSRRDRNFEVGVCPTDHKHKRPSNPHTNRVGLPGDVHLWDRGE